MAPAAKKRVNRAKPVVSPPDAKHTAAGDPQLDALVHELIGRIADKWTMIVLEVLSEHGTLRFGQLSDLCGGVSQKMLTQTLRQMERDGLVTRTVYAQVPPRVEYHRTELGETLGGAFCGVWEWAEKNRTRVDAARATFDQAHT